MDDTIHALATVPGKAGLAVVRISGPDATRVLSALGGARPAHRSSRLSTLRDRDGAVLDRALVLYFQDGASFTGEEVVELHLHGSLAGVALVLRALAQTGLSRMAEPGEFTRRALLNDRLDLTQVQGLADVIDAETEEQHRQAIRVFDGELSRQVASWRDDLIRSTALIAAVIDFADEEVPEDVMPEVVELIDRVRASIRKELDGVRAAERIRLGFTVAIVGAPNTGKSTLLNALTRSDAAIVSDLPGTTRDVIEVRLNIRGLAVSLLDTAGLRATEDRIEQLGIGRAIDRATRADLRIFLYEGDIVPVWDVLPQREDILLRSKVDLRTDRIPGISALTGLGLEDLVQRMGHVLSSRSGNAGLISRERDRAALVDALVMLDQLRDEIHQTPYEVVALVLREAMLLLQRIIGGVDIEAILDEVFSSFCLGK